MEALDQWFATNAKRIDLQIHIFENESLSRFQINDIDSKIQIQGLDYLGRGTSKDVHLAMKKSCCEAVERFFLHKNIVATSNGFAVHISSEQALESARNELIERDLFLCHFLTQTPFEKITIEDPWIVDIQSYLKAKDIELSFYSMGSINFVEGLLCSISGFQAKEPFGCILGSAAGERNKIVMASFLEAFRNYSHLNLKTAISLEQFLEKSTTRIDFIDHGNLSLNLEYAKNLIEPLLFVNGFSVEETFDLDLDIHYFDKADTPFNDAPLVVCRAISKNLQDMYTGEANASKLNERRLRQFCSAYSKPFHLITLPHPFN